MGGTISVLSDHLSFNSFLYKDLEKYQFQFQEILTFNLHQKFNFLDTCTTIPA